jgi:hypothetical protein
VVALTSTIYGVSLRENALIEGRDHVRLPNQSDHWVYHTDRSCLEQSKMGPDSLSRPRHPSSIGRHEAIDRAGSCLHTARRVAAELNAAATKSPS